MEPVIEVRAGAVLVCNDRLRVAGRHVDEIQIGVIGDRLPRHAAAVLHGVLVRPRLGARLALLLRHDIPPPLHLAALRIVRLHVPGNVEIVTADAGDDVSFHHHRRHRAVIELIEVADLLAPALLAVLDPERHEVAVGRFEVERVAGDGHATVADVDAALGFPGEVPELAAGAGIDRPDVIGQGEIEHSVNHHGRALDRHAAAEARCGPVDPAEAEVLHVGVGDLLQRAEAAAGIIAVVGWPAGRRRLGELRRIDPVGLLLCGENRRRQHYHAGAGYEARHFSVSR